MDENENILVLMTKFPSIEEANKVAKLLIENKLSACVHVLPQGKSFYIWENKLNIDDEFLVLIKTKTKYKDKTEEFIKKNHSYEIPELIGISPSHISKDYKNWLLEAFKIIL